MSTPQTHTSDPYAGLRFTRADRLEKALTFAGISHQDMADALGVTRQTIGNYTNGRTTRIAKLTLKEWAVRTGVPLQWLESGVFPDTPNPRPLDYKAKHSARIIAFPRRISAGAVRASA